MLTNQPTTRDGQAVSPFPTSFRGRPALLRKFDAPELRAQAQTLVYKQQLARDIVSSLRRSENPVVLVLSDRIELCNSPDNLFVASDLHSGDGEAYAGKGSLWSCNSRFCPNCVSKLARTNRKTIRSVMQSEKLLLGENWYFVTFTMPNLDLADLSLTEVADLMQTAWQRFTHSEAKGKSKTWFQRNIRGGFKNCEFTHTQNDVYNYHIHSALIAKSKIQADSFNAIRTAWTKALQFAFKKHCIPFRCLTRDGLANVNVQKITNREKAISEICKYVTKNDSWLKVPLAELEKLAVIPRFGRMFESFGVCRRTASEIKKNAAKQSAKENSTAQLDTNLDTENLTRRFSAEQNLTLPKKRRVPWRKRALETTRYICKLELRGEISQTQDFRKWQLRKTFSAASFFTLDNQTF